VKKNIILGLILFILCLLIGFLIQWMNIKDNKHVSDIADDAILKIAIYPSGGGDETYLFVLKPDEILEVSLGEIEEVTFESNLFLNKVNETKQKQLNVEDSKALLDAVNRIEEKSDTFQKELFKDGWDLSIYYKGRIMDMNYTSKSSEIEALINQLITLSPITVDLHSWS